MAACFVVNALAFRKMGPTLNSLLLFYLFVKFYDIYDILHKLPSYITANEKWESKEHTENLEAVQKAPQA